MPVQTPTLTQLRRALEIAERISALEEELEQTLRGTGLPNASGAPRQLKVRANRRAFSEATRAKMAAAQRARWAKQGGGSSSNGSSTSRDSASSQSNGKTRKKRVLSPEGRARIVAALKARHAARRQAA